MLGPVETHSLAEVQSKVHQFSNPKYPAHARLTTARDDDDLRCGGRQDIAEVGGLLAQVGHLAVLGFLLIGFGPDVLIGRFEFEQVIDGARDFVGGSDLRLHRAELGTFATIEGTEGTVTANDTGRRLSEGLPGAIVGLQGVIAQHFAAGNFVMGREAQPGAEMLLGGEATHVRADLTDNRLGQ